MLSDEERERIRHEALLRAEIRRELEAAMAKPAKRPGLFARISSKVAPTTLLAIFGTLITLLVGFYHDYATSKQHEAKQSADIRKANRDKGMTLLSTFPNEMETSHAILAAMVQKRLWLASHRSDTDTDELGRSRKQVEEEFSEVWRMYAEARKPYAILTEVKVFFDSPTVIAAADAANAAIAKEYGAKTEDELDTEVHEAEGLIERLTDAMSDELNEVMTRPKRVHGAGAGGAASAPDPALRSPRDVTLGDARAPVDP
jgi:hypothetical protein